MNSFTTDLFSPKSSMNGQYPKCATVGVLTEGVPATDGVLTEGVHDDRWQDRTYRQKVRIKGRFGALLIKILGAGVRVTRHDWENDRKGYQTGMPVLYVHWHGSMIVPLGVFRDRGIIILTSLSRDGDIQDMCMTCLGFRTIRGSSSRGGAKALLALIKNLKQNGAAAAMAVDGPRGPRHSSKPGAVLLAQKTGASVLPIGMAHSCCYHLKSWDKFEIPMPFSHSVIAVGEPFAIPADWPIDRGQKELDSRISATVDAATRRLRQ